MSRTDQVKLVITVGAGFTRAQHREEAYIDRDEWEGMSDEERELVKDDACQTAIENYIEAWCEVEE